MNCELVTVIIPCYNAGRWISEAIDSCLSQTHKPVEIVVVDDGSDDDSLEVLKSYGSRISCETGPNRGGNHARNRGFAVAKGEYIQYLDADDYLLPEKIELQLMFLQESQVDVAFEDWQIFDESVDGTRKFRPVAISWKDGDMLTALLHIWSPPPCAFLFRRSAIERAGGWTEGLSSAQDWDLHIRAALAGVSYGYLPGCYSAMRRSPAPTVTSRDRNNFNANLEKILQKTEMTLLERGGLREEYKYALANSYFKLARSGYFRTNRSHYDELLHHARRLSPAFKDEMSLPYRITSSVFGVGVAERLCLLKRLLGIV